jgi:hypothetical protein
VKKFLFFVLIILIALGVLYKKDVKPQVKEVTKQIDIPAPNEKAPVPVKAATPSTNTVKVPTQNESK